MLTFKIQDFLQSSEKRQRKMIYDTCLAPYPTVNPISGKVHQMVLDPVFGSKLDTVILDLAVQTIDATGNFYIIRPTIFSAEITRANIEQVHESWQYETAQIALVYYGIFAEDIIDLSTSHSQEPDRWIRHIPSDRRRPSGNPEGEYIRK